MVRNKLCWDGSYAVGFPKQRNSYQSSTTFNSILSKITVALSLINPNKDFDFVGRVIKTPCLFYFRSLKYHYVKETHMMLVAFWRWWNLLQYLGTKDNERNLCQDLLTIENTDSDMKEHALHYANKLLVCVRLSFQKLLQTRQTNRNNKKLSKQGLDIIKHCLGNSQINSIPE